MVGRKNSPNTSSGSVSPRNSRERSLSIASSLEDDDIVKPKSKPTEETENSTSVGAGGWGDDADEDLDYPIIKQKPETTESTIQKSRRSSSIASVADPLEISKNITDIKQLETDLIERAAGTIITSGKKSRSSSIINKTRSDSIVSIVGNKSRSESIVDLGVLESSNGTVKSKQIETEVIKQTSETKENSGKKSRANSLKNKSRSGSLLNSDTLDNFKSNTETKQLESELEQAKSKSRSNSIINFGKLTKSGGTETPEPEQVEAPKQQDIHDSIMAIPPGNLNIPEIAPEKMSQPSDNSMTKSISRNNSKKIKSNNNSTSFNSSNFDLSARDIERAKFAFSIYDFDGSERVDGFYIGDVLRALNLNPTNAVIESLGGTTRKREKFYMVEEFLPVYAECRKNKKAGSFEDFMEALKSYDRMEDGNLQLVELEHILLHLGERMEKSEINAVFVDCLPEEDDDGQIIYENFLRKLCEGLM